MGGARLPAAASSDRFVNVPVADETNLPADIPSYLSSQGTLADRQDGYMPSESGSSHQYMASAGGFYLQPKDLNGKNHFLTGRAAAGFFLS